MEAWKARLELHRNDTLVLQNFWAGQNQVSLGLVLGWELMKASGRVRTVKVDTTSH